MTTETGRNNLDGAELSVIANRVDAILREMTNTLLRSGRSAILATARDFSCSIVTGDDRLLATAEGLPVHIFGSHLQTAAVRDNHADISPGDAFLHNDPYTGNTHSADHTIIVPVFYQGMHLFNAVTKAHQADVGNSFPTTYMPLARDVYEEGALVFPSVRVQRDYADVDDVIRMCRSRIRVPDQWYGDYLACLGAARIGERRLSELVDVYGLSAIRDFIEHWFDYSEMRMENALKAIPSGSYSASNVFDPLPGVAPEGIPVRVDVQIDADAGTVDIDLRGNPDCLDAGINLSEATAINSAVTGVFNILGPDIPHTDGVFRRINVHLRENCITGVPIHPTSCSVATTGVADRVVNATQRALSEVGPIGLAEGGNSQGAGFAVISGSDCRRNDERFINEVVLGSNGGPASSLSDGWLTFTQPVAGGLMMRDSVEVDEQKYPIIVDSIELVPDSGGAGEFRGAGTFRVQYGPRFAPISVAVMCEARYNVPKGVRGGGAGLGSHVAVLDSSEERTLGSFTQFELSPHERLVGNEAGGGGFGAPYDREASAVLQDVVDGWVSVAAARSVYGVAFSGSLQGRDLTVDLKATGLLREELRSRVVPFVG